MCCAVYFTQCASSLYKGSFPGRINGDFFQKRQIYYKSVVANTEACRIVTAALNGE